MTRRWGYRLTHVKDSALGDATQAKRTQLPLRDMFVLTGSVAVFLAVVRFVPLLQLPIEIVGTVILIGTAIAGSAVLAWMGSLSSRNWLVRLAVTVVAVTAISTLPTLFFPQSRRPSTELLSLTLSITACVWLSCWLVRLRGWRFERVQ
jgi:hypothetical protein